MSAHLICPDCGGVVGATETTDDGAPCSCFKSGTTATKAQEFVTAVSVPDLSPAAAPGAPASQPKICAVCGADVTGRTRLKDSRGYICGPCAKAEKQALKGGPRCADCGRSVSEKALIEYNGLKICQFCRDDRVAKAKHDRKFSGVDSKNFNEHQKKQVFILLGVIGLLILIILLHHFKIIGSMI